MRNNKKILDLETYVGHNICNSWLCRPPKKLTQRLFIRKPCSFLAKVARACRYRSHIKRESQNFRLWFTSCPCMIEKQSKGAWCTLAAFQ